MVRIPCQMMLNLMLQKLSIPESFCCFHDANLYIDIQSTLPNKAEKDTQDVLNHRKVISVCVDYFVFMFRNKGEI